jgi:hypothetical protein
MSDFSDLQALIETRLDSCTQLKFGDPATSIPILSEDKHDLTNEINKAVDGIGILVLIGMPVLQCSEPEKIPANSLVELEIAIAENPVLNRDPEATTSSKIKAAAAAQYVAQRLHGWQPSCVFARLRLQAINFVPDPLKQIWEVKFQTDMMLGPI